MAEEHERKRRREAMVSISREQQKLHPGEPTRAALRVKQVFVKLFLLLSLILGEEY